MDISPEETPGESLSPRVVMISIVGFWLFYFAIVTVKSFVLDFDDQAAMLFPRAIVVILSIGITTLVYLCLRRISTASLRRSIVTAALLALPASIAYSTVNYYAFATLMTHEGERRREEHRKVVITRTDDEKNVTIQVGGDPYEDMEKSPLMAIGDQAANGYFFMAAWAALYLALCYAAQAVSAERRAAAFRTAAQSAELRALRYQVNPHFLFNTLNSLSSLVLIDRKAEAERMIQNLSIFFRTSLTGDPTEDVPLYEEIRLQRLYLDIEAVRFPERMIVDIVIPDALRTACVPGLILQPLIENSVKYGVSRSRRPVTVRVRAREDSDGLVLTVEDDGDPVSEGEVSTGIGVGLRNVRDRLAARFGSAGGCRWGPLPGGGFAVTLFMPLVRHG